MAVAETKFDARFQILAKNFGSPVRFTTTVTWGFSGAVKLQAA
jgi:hypothetical protein